MDHADGPEFEVVALLGKTLVALMLSRFALQFFAAALDIPTQTMHRVATDKSRVNQYQKH